MRKLLIVAEVSVILVLFVYLKGVLESTEFGDWQEAVFGAPILSSCLLFFVLPLTTLIVTHRNPGVYGLTVGNLRRHVRLASQAVPFVIPATFLFPVIALLGTDHRQWLGASMLALGFTAGGILALRFTRSIEDIAETQLSFGGILGHIGLLVAGVALCHLLRPISELVTRIIIVLIFVAFLEEFFFRGYMQARLNEVFGRPYSLFNVSYGLGLISSAVVFGLLHPLTVTNATPWAWALWTAAGGLIFGFLREKSGAVITPALVHGAILVPGVLFGGS